MAFINYCAAFIPIGLLLIPALRTRSQAAIVLPDPSWEATLLATNRIGLVSPDGILFRNGKLILADEGGSSVEVGSPDQPLTRIAASTDGLESPEDIVLDKEGNLFFTDDDAGGVREIDAKGHIKLLATKEQGLISTEGIALTPWGTILAGDGERHTIFEVTKDGKVSVYLTGIDKPESLAFDDQGRLYVADNRAMLVYLYEGKNGRVILDKDNLQSPESIAWRNGALYITDPVAGRVYRYTEMGGLTTIAVVSGSLRNVQGIDVGDDGAVYITVQQSIKGRRGCILRLAQKTTAAAANSSAN